MNKTNIEKRDKKGHDLAVIANDAKKYFGSAEFKNSPREMEKIYNTLSPERLLKRMTI